VPFSAEGAQTTTATLAAGDVSFWTDIDVEYTGDASLVYAIDLVQNGASVAKATCNPLGQMSAKIGWLEADLGSAHSRKGSGKMACAAKLARGGPTTVNAKLAFAQKPESATLRKADLVVKQ
jgi:hypothetical protein